MRSMSMLVACVALAACNQKANEKPPTPVEPKAAKFSLNGQGAAEVVKGGAREAAVTHTPYILWEYWECDVSWGQTCGDSMEMLAPAGFQVCKALYVEHTNNGHSSEFGVQPSSFYPNDPQSPDRFRGIVATISARGSPIPGGDGAKMRVENLGLDLIPAEADNFTRYWEGCWMPAHD